MTQSNLTKKNVLITGASRGIGASLAKQFAREGCSLFLIGRDENQLKETGNVIRSMGIDPILSINNLASAEERKKVFQTTTEKGFHVDVLVNNVGVGHWKNFKDTPEEKIQEIINVNINCMTHLTKLFLPGMLERNSGQIVNLSSTAAFIGAPNSVCYSATKAYISSFSESLSMELYGTGVKVLIVNPGATDTSFWDRAGMKGNIYESKVRKMAPEIVAQKTINALKIGSPEITVGFKNKINIFVIKIFPRNWILKIALKRFKSK